MKRSKFDVTLKSHSDTLRVPEDLHDAVVEALWFHPSFGGAIPTDLHPHLYTVCHEKPGPINLFSLTNASLYLTSDGKLDVQSEYGRTNLMCPKFWTEIADPPVSDFNLPRLESLSTLRGMLVTRYKRLDSAIDTFLNFPSLTNDVLYTLWPWLHAKAKRGRYHWSREVLPTPPLKRTSPNLAKVSAFLAENHPNLIEQAEEDRLWLEFQKVPL